MNFTCAATREAVSARLDGEDPGIPADAVDAHLAACAGCRRYHEEAAALHRSARIRTAEAAPDLTPAILARIGAEVQAGRAAAYRGELRVALAVVAVVQLIAALPALVMGGDVGAPVHAARELGSFSAALAVGFLVCAWQPRRASGLLPVAGALAAFLGITAVLDLATGRASVLIEATHLLELIGLALLVLLDRTGPASRRTGQRRAAVGR